MDDIITRLTAFHGLPRCTTPGCVTCDAADEIERLHQEIKRLTRLYNNMKHLWIETHNQLGAEIAANPRQPALKNMIKLSEDAGMYDLH